MTADERHIAAHQFAARLRVAMAHKALRQKDLAEQIEADPSIVSRWCKAQTQPAIYFLPKISAVLGISLQWLITGTGQAWEEKL